MLAVRAALGSQKKTQLSALDKTGAAETSGPHFFTLFRGSYVADAALPDIGAIDAPPAGSERAHGAGLVYETCVGRIAPRPSG